MNKETITSIKKLRAFANTWHSEGGIVNIGATLNSIADQIEDAFRAEFEARSGEELCPLLNRPCTEDCAWADVQYEINEDGVANETFCAVAVIAAKLIVMEDEDE